MKTNKKAKVTIKDVYYIEPDDYFPKEIRKKYGLGEYAKKTNENEKTGIMDDTGMNEEIKEFKDNK